MPTLRRRGARSGGAGPLARPSVGREVGLARAADRAEPVVGDVLERRAGRDAAVGVALGGVVDEPAGLADPLLRQFCVASWAARVPLASQWLSVGSSPRARARSSTPARPTDAAPGGDGDRAARRRRRARGAARAAQPGAALHGRRVGLPGRRGRRRRRRGRRGAPRAPACARSRRRPAIALPDPARSSRSRAGSRRAGREDPLRHAGSSSPRRPDDAEPRIDGGECVDCGWFTPRGGARRATRAGELSSSSRRSSTSSSWPRFAQRRRAARRGRAGARSSRSSRASCSRARSRACVLPGEPGYDGLTCAERRAAHRRRHRPDRRHRPRVRARARAPQRTSGAILGMARRPFDPAAPGWRKTEYRQGDVLDRAAVDALVADADVVVHLAFVDHGRARGEPPRQPRGLAQRVRRGRAAGVRSGSSTPRRSPPTASTPTTRPLTEDVPPRGTTRTTTRRRRPRSRSCCGETSAARDRRLRLPALHRRRPGRADADRVDPVGLRMPPRLPFSGPCSPDPGVPFQLVHHDDVATRAAWPRCAGAARPASTTSPAPGELDARDLAADARLVRVPVPRAVGRRSRPRPPRLPLVPAKAQWLNALRVPVVMSTARARKELRWRPRHSASETLEAAVAAARQRGIVK